MEPHRSIDQNAPLSYRGARQLLGLIVLLVISAFILRALESVLLLFAIVFLVLTFGFSQPVSQHRDPALRALEAECEQRLSSVKS